MFDLHSGPVGVQARNLALTEKSCCIEVARTCAARYTSFPRNRMPVGVGGVQVIPVAVASVVASKHQVPNTVRELCARFPVGEVLQPLTVPSWGLGQHMFNGLLATGTCDRLPTDRIFAGSDPRHLVLVKHELETGPPVPSLVGPEALADFIVWCKLDCLLAQEVQSVVEAPLAPIQAMCRPSDSGSTCVGPQGPDREDPTGEQLGSSR